MREGAKQRLVGAVVIVALVVIFVPMLFEPRSLEPAPAEQEAIPAAPPFEPDLKSEVFLGPGDSGIGGSEHGARESRPLPLPSAGDLDPASVAGVPGEGPDEAEAEGTSGESTLASARPPATRLAAPAREAAPVRGGRDGLPSWVVQVASLGTPEAAGELEQKLRKAGFSAFVEQAEVRGKLFYRVRVGPESDRASAERTAARLREQQKLDTLIQGYP